MLELDMNVEEIINQPSMAIIIDCWKEFDSDIERQTMENIQKLCFNNPFIKTIGLASYIGPADESKVAVEEPWFTNGKDFFYNRLRWENLRRLWERTKFIEQKATHDLILNMPIREDQAHFSFWNNLQLLYYCNYINPSIKNIYLFGFAWDNCITWRSLGWKEIQNLTICNMFSSKKNILSNLTCTLNQDIERVDQVSSPWIKLNETYVMIDNTL